MGANRHGNSNFKRPIVPNIAHTHRTNETHAATNPTPQNKRQLTHGTAQWQQPRAGQMGNTHGATNPTPQNKKQLASDTTQWQQPRPGKVGGTWGDQPNTTEPKTTDTRHNTMEATNDWEGGWAKQASPDSRGEV